VGPAPGAQAIAQQGHPSPFTRCGPGIASEIKPEIVEYGGNLTWDGGLVRENYGCSIPVATHQLTPALSAAVQVLAAILDRRSVGAGHRPPCP
jgi:hypothetical protein